MTLQAPEATSTSAAVMPDDNDMYFALAKSSSHNSSSPIPSGGTSTTNSNIVLNPLPNDVIVGRGKHRTHSPGNTLYRNLIDSLFTQYDNSNCKFMISDHVIDTIMQNHGGRFLQQVKYNAELHGPLPTTTSGSATTTHNGGFGGVGATKGKEVKVYIALSRDEARIRVAHAFRNKRLLRPGQQQQQQQQVGQSVRNTQVDGGETWVAGTTKNNGSANATTMTASMDNNAVSNGMIRSLSVDHPEDGCFGKPFSSCWTAESK